MTNQTNNNSEQNTNQETEQQKQQRIHREKFGGALNVPSLYCNPEDSFEAQQEAITKAYGEGMPTVSTTKDPYLYQGYVDPMEEYVQEGGIQENSLPSLNNSKLNDNRRLQ